MTQDETSNLILRKMMDIQKLIHEVCDLEVSLEREACAKLLETTDLSGLKDNPAMQSWVANMLLAYVKAIRARGDKA